MIMGLNYPVCTQYACDRLRGDWEKRMPIKFVQQLKPPQGLTRSNALLPTWGWVWRSPCRLRLRDRFDRFQLIHAIPGYLLILSGIVSIRIVFIGIFRLANPKSHRCPPAGGLSSIRLQ